MKPLLALAGIVLIIYGGYKSWGVFAGMGKGEFLGVETNPEQVEIDSPFETSDIEEKQSIRERGLKDIRRDQLESELVNLELKLEQARLDGIDDRERRGKEKAKRDEKRKEQEKNFVVHKFLNRKVPTVETIGDLLGEKVIVDERTNTIIVRVVTVLTMAKVSGVLAALDHGPARSQYRVEAVIVNASLIGSDEFSIDWVAKYSYPGKVVKNWNFNLGSGAVGIESTWLDLAVEKAQIEGALAVIARPNLILGQGEKASISSGREVPIPISNVQDGNVQSSIQYRSVALELEVTLKEIGENRLALGIKQVNEQITGTVRVGVNDVPELSSQRWETQIEPEFGRWYAVGGVSADSEKEGKRKGWFFKNRDSRSKERREIGMFIRVVPVIAENYVPANPRDLVPFRSEPLRAVPVRSAYAVPAK